jgi:hypothetical protein
MSQASFAGTAGGAGAFARSPAGAPASIHARIADFSSTSSRRSLSHVPVSPAACQGGIRPSATAARIVAVRDFTSS